MLLSNHEVEPLESPEKIESTVVPQQMDESIHPPPEQNQVNQAECTENQQETSLLLEKP